MKTTEALKAERFIDLREATDYAAALEEMLEEIKAGIDEVLDTYTSKDYDWLKHVVEITFNGTTYRLHSNSDTYCELVDMISTLIEEEKEVLK